MQMYSIFDVNKVTMSQPIQLDVKEPVFLRRITVEYGGGTVLITLYTEDPAAIEVEEKKEKNGE